MFSSHILPFAQRSLYLMTASSSSSSCRAKAHLSISRFYSSTELKSRRTTSSRERPGANLAPTIHFPTVLVHLPSHSSKSPRAISSRLSAELTTLRKQQSKKALNNEERCTAPWRRSGRLVIGLGMIAIAQQGKGPAPYSKNSLRSSTLLSPQPLCLLPSLPLLAKQCPAPAHRVIPALLNLQPPKVHPSSKPTLKPNTSTPPSAV